MTRADTVSSKQEEIRKEILARERVVMSRENIREKMNFINFLEQTYHKDPVPEIHHALFTLARDINPAVRLRALTIFANVAPVSPELIKITLSKGDEHDDTSRVDKPHIGTFGMCLEDAVPEIRAMAVKAIGASIQKSDDPCALEVMTAIAQMLNDSSVSVRAASITALIKVSRIMNHLITLEDHQLRMVLPVLTAIDSSVSDRRDVIYFLSQVETASYEQTTRIFEELGRCVLSIKYQTERDDVLSAAYSFGHNNSYFMRLTAADFLATLSSVRKVWLNLSAGDVFVKVVAILAACRRTPFMIPDELVKCAHMMLPLLDSLQKKRHAVDQGQTTFVDLQELESQIRTSQTHLKRVIDKDPSLQDACDYLLGKEPPEMFKIVESHENPKLVSVQKYMGVIIEPPANSRYNPYMSNLSRDGERNIFLRVRGKVTPNPIQGTTTIVVIDVPLRGIVYPSTPSYQCEAMLDENGNFVVNPSIVLPAIQPQVPVTLKIVLIHANGVSTLISEPVEVWFRDSTYDC